MVNEVTSSKTVIFISHANPEDNDFARWLTLQLAQNGYSVWCDVAKLIGGEDFWRDIEVAIREHTAKFIFVLSGASNAKQGTLDELNVARIMAARERIHDFILPLRLDDIPFGDINISLARLNVIRFNESWAQGLSDLLVKLEKDSVPKTPNWSPTTVARWWRDHHSAAEGVRSEPEDYLSNWFPLSAPPESIFFHEITRSGPGLTLPQSPFRYPTEEHGSYIVTFAEADLLSPEVLPPHRIVRTLSFPFSAFLSEEKTLANMERGDRRRVVVSLLRQSWDSCVKSKGVGIYELANKQTCAYLRQVDGNDVRVSFSRGGGKVSLRSLTGFKTVLGPDPDNKKKRFWHFAISARPMVHPVIGFAVYTHVVFSDDGRSLWDDKERMHRARRQQCKGWWNPIWRDRMLAFLAWLADDEESINLPSGKHSLQVLIEPVLFESPASYYPQAGNYEITETYEEPLDTPQGGMEEDEDFEDEEFEGELNV